MPAGKNARRAQKEIDQAMLNRADAVLARLNAPVNGKDASVNHSAVSMKASSSHVNPIMRNTLFFVTFFPLKWSLLCFPGG